MIKTLPLLSFAAALSILSSCRSDSFDVQKAFGEAEGQLLVQMAAADSMTSLQPMRGERYFITPRTINRDGSLRMVTFDDWTCGFYPGMLWYMYEQTGNDNWRAKAETETEKMVDCQYNTGTHDIGFLMFCSYGNGLRLTDKAGYREVLVESARSLTKRYNPTIGCIRSWDHGRWDFPVIIDNMMNLELLFWAAETTGEKEFFDIAISHADKTLANHYRADGSCYHVIDYNPETGEVQARNTAQGFRDETSWARGQAWGLYGFTMCYRATGYERYLQQAHRIADYILNCSDMPDDLIPYWDYQALNRPNAPRDVSAAMITASALYELSTYDGNNDYDKAADRILENVYNNYRNRPGENYGFQLLHSTGNLPSNDEIDVPIIYADYYYLEALTRRARLDRNQNVVE